MLIGCSFCYRQKEKLLKNKYHEPYIKKNPYIIKEEERVYSERKTLFLKIKLIYVLITGIYYFKLYILFYQTNLVTAISYFI